MQPWNSSFPPTKGDGGSGVSQGCHSRLSGTEEDNHVIPGPKAQPPSCQPPCHCRHLCLRVFPLICPQDAASYPGFCCGIGVAARNFYGDLLWFLLSLRLLNISSSCVCFLKQLAVLISLPFVHQ